MNEAVAYLVLACGTGGDNRTTSWSSQALHKYSGIAWERGKAAIEHLIESGLIRQGKEHTRQKPCYELVALKKGKAEIDSDDLLWLPNTIVTGTSNGEPSPIKRLRSSGDPWALRLFVDLYKAQNLRDDGGINRAIFWESFERKRVGERGIFVIWGFKGGTKTLQLEGPFAAHMERPQKEEEHPVWESVCLLEQMGLLTYVPHLFENSSPQAEPIHAYGVNRKGEEPIESEIGEVADSAARRLCQEWAIEEAINEGFEYLCPVPQTLPDVQLIGVARLRYRPHTSRTAAWYGHLHTSGKTALAFYRKVAEGEAGQLDLRRA
jgi:hypothetical protein